MLHTKLVEISLPVPEKIFKGILPYVGMAAILVMGPAKKSSDFHYLGPESFHEKFGSDWQSCFRKSGLNFCMYMTLLTFNTHIPSYIQ